MARIFITGSSDGLGRMAASVLVGRGHRVVLHARNENRAREATASVPGAAGVLVGDLASLSAVRGLAEAANGWVRRDGAPAFDAVIHNAAVGYKEKRRIETADGLSQVFAVNTLAPYVLTALMARPSRLVYVASELHRRGDATLRDLQWRDRAWAGTQAYSDSKFHDVVLALAVARRWPAVASNAIEPGWVPTKMSGPRATGDHDNGCRTQAWLAGGEAAEGRPVPTGSGGYFYHLAPQRLHARAGDEGVQDALVAECGRLCGVPLGSA